MAHILALLLTLSNGRKIEYIDGSAIGFTAIDSFVTVVVHTNKGKQFVENCLCSIDRFGEFCVSVDEGPRDIPFYILNINPPNCLRKKFKVVVPKKGIPRLTIRQDDFIFGDLTGDNKIDNEDLKWVIQAVGIKKGDLRWNKEIVSPDSMEFGEFFDFNHDGIVDSKDVDYIRRNLGKHGEFGNRFK